MAKVVIFGAGKWGHCAWVYLKDVYEIEAFVDNNSKLWGSVLDGLPVYSPDFLYNFKQGGNFVVIANAKHKKDIKNQLLQHYGLKSVLVFNISVNVERLCNYKASSENDELIVSFCGGLGNQMFQYVLYRLYLKSNKNVKADLLHYYKPNVRPFGLQDVFGNIVIDECCYETLTKYQHMPPYISEDESFVYYSEPDVMENVKKLFNPKIIESKIKCGYLKGYFQTREYAEIIKEDLLKDFTFTNINDAGLKKLVSQISVQNTVSVHIRRGDYLLSPGIYGNICTMDYYKKALGFIESKVDNPIFIFFSNDMEWVKENFNINNSIYISSDLFEVYMDWYDMYLMSICKHNIIANSSFSWWGAWLNNNSDKLVIAPKKWVNADSMYDICPESWIRI